MTELIQALVDGSGKGGIYALVALGFVVIFRTTGVLNFALAETGLVGAYVAAVVLDRELPLGLAVVAGGLVGAGLGWLTQRAVLQRAQRGGHLVAVLITLGVALLLRATVALVFGTEERSLQTSLGATTWRLGDVVVWQLHAVSLVVAVLLVAATAGFLRWTRAGLAMRALTDDEPAARLMGIGAPGAAASAFAVAGALASLAVLLSAQTGFLSLGTAEIGIHVLPVLVIGGFASVWGTLIGGLLVGVAEQLTATYVGGELVELAPFVLLLIVLAARPAGLFGEHRLGRV